MFITSLLLGLTIGSAIYGIIKLLGDEDYFESNLTAIIFFIIILCVSAFFMVFTIALLGFHSYLILTNQTTNEFLKNNNNSYLANPFSGTVIRNIKKFCMSHRKKGHLRTIRDHYKEEEEEKTPITEGMRSDKGSQE